MNGCTQKCKELKTSCPVKDCRYWIEYEKDLNCSIIAIEKEGEMSLREVGKRLGISHVRVKQIEDKIKRKLKHLAI